MAKKRGDLDLQTHYKRYLGSMWRRSPFVLRITEWKDYPVPVLLVKERYEFLEESNRRPGKENPKKEAEQSIKRLVQRGHLAGSAQRRCLPVLRRIVERVCDENGIPLELQRYLSQNGLKLRLNLPLDEEAGAKLGLIFRLQERVIDLDRVELMARRVARFTREEAVYWLSRTTSYGPDANRWAISGLRVVLGGQPNDPGVERMLQELQAGS